MAFLDAIIQMVGIVTRVLITLVIVQFVIGLLFAFNVVNHRNQFLSSVYDAINRLLDPLFRPMRRFLPNTGAIDFSPLVLIILLQFVMILLDALRSSI